MSQKAFFTIVAIVYALLGFGNLLAPAASMAGFGLTFDPSADLFARVLGTAAIAFAIIMWACRDAPPSQLFTAVLCASLTEKVLQVILVAYAVNIGTMNTMGWAMGGLQFLFAVGFAYFAFGKRPSVAPA